MVEPLATFDPLILGQKTKLTVLAEEEKICAVKLIKK